MTDFMYEQATGLLCGIDEGGEWYPIEDCYAGKGVHCNNPASHRLKNLGPLPRGRYRITGPVDHPRLGPVSMFLRPDQDNEMFNRSGFFIHGDNRSRNRTASSGCIILSRQNRELIARHSPAWLAVVRGVREDEDIEHFGSEMLPA